MMKALHFLVSVLILFAANTSAQQVFYPENLETSDFVQGSIIFKLKDTYLEKLGNGPNTEKFNIELNIAGIEDIRQSFPKVQKPKSGFDRAGRKFADIRGVGTMQYSGNKPLKLVLFELAKSGYFEWVQPRFVHRPMFTPNDPQIAQQYHHALIKTFEAFDIEQGDTNVYIGITDAGIQFEHQDLGNVRYNYADPVNGLDDDNNGYIDDFRGWNTASNTNNPTATLSPHGMFTTGMSSATVNNGIGVAGNAYRCKFVPVRIDDANGFTFGYEGIVYLAELGCKFINASWGGTFPDPFGEEIIRYAIVNKEALIVAAAGNSGINEKYYPASYEGVFSVAATGSADIAWSGSTFGPGVDICAPGELVRSCWPFNGYDISSGTSFSAPLVTGAAALVKSHFPSYSAQQVAERLRITADTSIYTLPGNSAVNQLLGSGRLNMLRALTDPERPSIHFINPEFVNNSENTFLAAGDTVSLIGAFYNYLAPAQNLAVSISSDNAFVEIIDNSYAAGSIASLDAHAQLTPFTFRISPNAPYNLDVVLKLRYSDAASGYFAFEYVEVRVNKDYMDLTLNNLKTTITSRGSIGYNANYATDGIGVAYQNGSSQIYSAGFILGSSEQVADNVYAATLPGYDDDFAREIAVNKTSDADGSQCIRSAFSTDSAGAQQIRIQQKACAKPNENYVEMTYTLINQGNEPSASLSAGIFADWDIANNSQNRCTYDPMYKMIYAFDESNPTVYFGIKLLSSLSANPYCFNNNGAGGSISLYDGFTDAEKFAALSGSLTRNASLTGEISALLGATVGAIQPGDSVQISFAILGASSLIALQESAWNAQLNFNMNRLQINLTSINETCNGAPGSFSASSAIPGFAQIQVLDTNEIALSPPILLTGTYNSEPLNPGNYLLEVSFDDGTYEHVPFEIQNADPVAILGLDVSAELVVLPNATVDFLANFNGNGTVSWTFGDGTEATGNPVTHTYTAEGAYEIICTISNSICSDSFAVFVEVGTAVGMRNESIRAIDLFPNPASHFIALQPNNNKPLKGEIRNMAGKLIDTFTDGNHINIQGLANGIYFLNIDSGNSIQNYRFVVAR